MFVLCLFLGGGLLGLFDGVEWLGCGKKWIEVVWVWVFVWYGCSDLKCFS